MTTFFSGFDWALTTRRAIIRQHRDGVSVEDLAERYGLTPEVVRLIVERPGCTEAVHGPR
jgi:Mor family transcriptional regulator